MSAIVRSCFESLVSERETAVAVRVLEELSASREHVVVLLSGAHAYGFPSPDSDLDLKAIHLADTSSLLGLHAPKPTADRAEIVDGVEIDYTSNELGHALAGILAGNGNFIERVLGRTQVVVSPILDELRPLVARSLSRKLHAHYRGFSFSQLKLLEKEPTAKKLLYVLRTALTGLHALVTGSIEADLGVTAGLYGFADTQELVAQKRAGEKVPLSSETIAAWRPRVDALLERLDEARASSPLPEEAPNEAELDAWLREVRRRSLV
jgi:uncharacterized protein